MGGWSDLARAVKERTDIAALIGQRVQLRREGNSMVGLCPFHTEKSPSFNVIPDKGFYHCFGCGKHGDAIEWVMQRDGIEFKIAVLDMARECGLDPDQYLGGQVRPAQRSDTDTSILAIMAEAVRWTGTRLAGSPAMAALERRPGVDPAQAIEHFDIGYAPPDGGALVAHLRARGFSDDLMIAAGVASRSDDGRLYSFLRGRLTLPIRDTRGRPIALAGRTLDDEVKPKWLNTRESSVFRKGETLFNMDMARSHARGGLVVVEGYFDAMALALNGIRNVIATMGTSLTDSHLAAIKKYASRLVLAFDGDQAGLRACDKAIKMALPMGLDVRLYLLPMGEDPDTLVAKMGGEAMASAIQTCPDWTNHTLSRLMDGRNMRNLRDQAEVIRGFSAFAPHIATREEKWSLVNTLSHRIGMPREDVMDILRKAVVEVAREGAVIEAAVSDADGNDRPATIHPVIEEMVLAFISFGTDTQLATIPCSWWESLAGAWIIQSAIDAAETGDAMDPAAELAVRKIEARASRLGISPVPTAKLLAKLELGNIDAETKSAMSRIDEYRRSGDGAMAERLEGRVNDLMARRLALQKILRGGC
jgi:DNA primase